MPSGSSVCHKNCTVLLYPNADDTGWTGVHGEVSQQCAWGLEGLLDCTTYAGTGAVWSVIRQACIRPSPPDCAPNETKNPVTGACSPSCPSGQMVNVDGYCTPEGETCPPGQAKGPDGSCVDGTGCFGGMACGADGTCKPEGEDEYFSGGDICQQPPACAGSPILCGSARIQWRIDCNTRRNVNISGGQCNAVPLCTGEKCNAMEYVILI